MGILNCCDSVCLNKKEAEDRGKQYAIENPSRPIYNHDQREVYVEIKGKRVYLWSPYEKETTDLIYNKIRNLRSCYYMGAAACYFTGIGLGLTNSNFFSIGSIGTLFFYILVVKNMMLSSVYTKEYALQAAVKYNVDNYREPLEGIPDNQEEGQGQIVEQEIDQIEGPLAIETPVEINVLSILSQPNEAKRPEDPIESKEDSEVVFYV